jgi:hypothetical protein
MTTTSDPIAVVVETNMSLIDRAGSLDVMDEHSADQAGRLLMQVNSVLREIDEARFDITRPLDQAKARAMAQAEAAKAPYLEAKQQLDGLILEWNLREKARISYERAEAEAKAIIAAAEGRLDDATDAILQMEAVPAKVHRVAGTQVRETWSATVDHMPTFVEWIAADPTRIALYMTVNKSALDALARSTKGTSPIPGVTFHAKHGVASTARA